MAEEGLVKRREANDVVPPRVYYSLTPKGQDACMILERFKAYGIKWGQGGTVDCTKVDCELCPRNKEVASVTASA
jgi:DNA-binding HxlR family transcriptional regulator